MPMMCESWQYEEEEKQDVEGKSREYDAPFMPDSFAPFFVVKTSLQPVDLSRLIRR